MKLITPPTIERDEAMRIAHVAVAEHEAAQDADELGELLHYLSRRPPRRILEIGTYRGGTLWAWRVAFPAADIVCVDREIPCEACERRRAHSDCVRARVRSLASTVVIGDSTDYDTRDRVWPLAGDLERGEGFDFVFVDGGHDRAHVESDFGFYCPMLAGTGVIAFHDIAADQWPAVGRFWHNLERMLPGQAFPIVSPRGEYGIGVLPKPE